MTPRLKNKKGYMLTSHVNPCHIILGPHNIQIKNLRLDVIYCNM